MSWSKIEKETGNWNKVDKTDKGHLRDGWFYDWLSGELWKKVNKLVGNWNKVSKE